jgi:hypothetical protein
VSPEPPCLGAEGAFGFKRRVVASSSRRPTAKRNVTR